MRALWYYPDINRFTDDDGYIIHDLSEFFPQWELDKWKKYRDYDILTDRQGERWEIFYLYPDDEEMYVDGNNEIFRRN